MFENNQKIHKPLIQNFAYPTEKKSGPMRDCLPNASTQWYNGPNNNPLQRNEKKKKKMAWAVMRPAN